MKQKINWTNHFVELIVVVIGITIAFMLEGWRRDNANEELEQKYLNGFKNDLLSDKLQLDSTITSVEKQLSDLNEFITMIKSGSFEHHKADNVVPQILTSFSFAPKQVTYQSILNSGNLNIFSDYKFVELITSYYDSNEEVIIKEKVLYDYQLKFVLPYIYKNVEFITGKAVNKTSLNTFEFRNIVAGYYALVLQNFEPYKNYKTLNNELVDNLSMLIDK